MLIGHTGSINSLKIGKYTAEQPEGMQLFSGSDDCTVKIWNIANQNECIRTIKMDDAVTALKIDNDYKLMIVGLKNGLIVI